MKKKFNDEARELSVKVSQKGWRTTVLGGEDSEKARAKAMERLAGDEGEDAIDYIISVDFFLRDGNSRAAKLSREKHRRKHSCAKSRKNWIQKLRSVS